MILIGVDPGKVTGVAVWRQHDRWFESYEVDEPGKVPTWIRTLVEGERPTLIGCERFTSAPGPRALSAQPDATAVVGMMRSLAEELQCRCVYQSPGPAKKIAPNARLRKLGWYLNTPDEHANDAARQIVLLLASFFPETFAELTGL